MERHRDTCREPGRAREQAEAPPTGEAVSADPAEGDDGGHDPVHAYERHDPGATRPCEQERDAESKCHPASDEEQVVRPSRELAHCAQPGRVDAVRAMCHEWCRHLSRSL